VGYTNGKSAAPLAVADSSSEAVLVLTAQPVSIRGCLAKIAANEKMLPVEKSVVKILEPDSRLWIISKS
jgi:hypothetical protein